MSRRNLLGLEKLVIVMSTVLILGLSNSSIAVEKEGVGVSMEKSYKQALLDNDVKEFYDLIGRFGHHAVAVGDEVYIQPYVYLSLHLVQMRSAGWKDMDYDQIAAVSGASALFGYEPGEFRPKYANRSIGMDERIAEATGFGYEWIKYEGIDGAWELLKASVDSGKSVKGEDWENIMFAGYQDAEKPEDRKVYAMADGPGNYSKWITWKEFGEYIDRMKQWNCMQFGRYTERILTKPADEVATRVIKDLVEWSNNPPENISKIFPKATFGLAGIQIYADDCADMEKNKDFGPCHDINPQWPVRNSSSVYLKQVAKANVFPDNINTHLLKASDEYKNAYIYWKQFYNHLSYGGGDGWGKIAEHRLAGTESLRKALEHEKLAIAELKIVLENANITEEKKQVIDGVDRYRVMEACYEGVRVILSYRGERYSPEYIQGISGAAFRIAGICPCAPTCSGMMSTQDLPKLLGYEVDYVPLSQEGANLNALANDAIAQVKEEIRNGRPVLVWNAFTTAEWDVVCGYDDEKKQFMGRGSYAGMDKYATADEIHMTMFDPALGAVFIRDKVDEFNTKEAELASLKEAVKHAHTIKEIPADGKWVFLEGLQCYDRWVNDFKSDPNKKRGSGDSYCLGIYRSTHRAAGGFMKELMPKYPEAKENLEKASEYFITEANTLDQCDSLIGWNTPEGPDADRNAKTGKLLEQARDNYSNAINEIEEAIKKIEARIPKIVKKDAFLVAGLRYEGKNQNNEIPAVWDKFINRINELGLDNTKPIVAYGVSHGIPNAEPGVFEYLSAVEVKSITNLPQGMVGWEMPAQTYAVFPVYGLTDLGRAYSYSLSEWLPQSKEYISVDSPVLEYYPETFDQDSILYIYIPIKQK